RRRWMMHNMRQSEWGKNAVRYHVHNMIVIVAAVAVLIITVASLDSGRILRSGGGFGLAAILFAKGVSRLRGSLSDVWLAVAVLVLVLASKTVNPKLTSPLIFESVAIALTLIFILTGLTFRSIAIEQKERREHNRTS